MKLARARVHNLSFSQDCARSWTACPELIPSSCLCEQVAGEHSETLNGLGRLRRCPKLTNWEEALFPTPQLLAF
jgi:hypothetical protein